MKSGSPLLLALTAIAASSTIALAQETSQDFSLALEDAEGWIVHRLKVCFDCPDKNSSHFQPLASGLWGEAKHWYQKISMNIGEDIEEDVVKKFGDKFEDLHILEEFLKIVLHCFKDVIHL